MSWTLKQKYRDRIASETGPPRPVRGDCLSVCLAYPNPYRTGMSNLGFQTIYAMLNRHEGFFCERAFLPDPGEEALFTPG